MASANDVKLVVLRGNRQKKQDKTEVVFTAVRVDDGYLGRYTGPSTVSEHNPRGTVFRVLAVVPEGVGAYAVAVDGTKNVSRKKDVMTRPEFAVAHPALIGNRVYQTDVAVHWSDRYACDVTRYPENYFGMIILGDGGRFTYTEVSIVSQMGEFFLVQQEGKYSGQAYRNGAEVVCPQFATGWPQFARVVGLLFSEHFIRHPELLIELEDVSKYVPQPAPTENRRTKSDRALKADEAEVDWWDAAKGMGVLLTPDRTARVFVTEVAPPKGQRFAGLTSGQVVRVTEFKALDTSKGSFAWEALGVKPLD